MYLPNSKLFCTYQTANKKSMDIAESLDIANFFVGKFLKVLKMLLVHNTVISSKNNPRFQ